MVVATRPSTSSFVVISPETPLDELRSKLVGELLTADSIEFEQARRTPNIKSNRFPKAIVRAASEYDVSLAVAFPASKDSRWRCAAVDTAWPFTPWLTMLS